MSATAAFVRSTSSGDLHDPEALRGYVLGEHVVDALRRIAISVQDEPRTRAFSITGPYRSGKSIFRAFALRSPRPQKRTYTPQRGQASATSGLAADGTHSYVSAGNSGYRTAG